MPRGGHFAALETPELLVDDVRAFFSAQDLGTGMSDPTLPTELADLRDRVSAFIARS